MRKVRVVPAGSKAAAESMAVSISDTEARNTGEQFIRACSGLEAAGAAHEQRITQLRYESRESV